MLGFVKNYLTKRGGKQEYEEMLKKFLCDGKLDDAEKQELEVLATRYNLTKEDLTAAQKRIASQVFQDISSDDRITDEEKESLEELMKYFGFSREDFNFDQGTFNKLYSLALIDKGILPTPEYSGLNIILKKEEVVHWLCSATLKKRKRVVDRISYSGLSTSIRIMKGVRYRVGSIKLAPQTKDVMIDEDSGNFWLTNQRIGFLGHRKNFSLPYNKVLSFDLYRDGIAIHKEGRENPYIIGLA